MATRMYGIVWRWHFFAGLAAAPLIFILCITGIGYAFEPEITRWLDDDATVAPSDAPPASLDAIIAAGTSPTCKPSAVAIPGRRDEAARIYCAEGTQRHVLVDPYRGTKIVEREGLGVMDVIFELHWELLAGDWGRRAIEWATSWAVVLFASGAVLWWPRGKRRGGGVWWVRRGLKPRELLRDLHAVGGMYAVPCALIITATGLMWTMHAGEHRWEPLAHDAVHASFDAPPTSTPPAGVADVAKDAKAEGDAAQAKDAGPPRLSVDRAFASTGVVRGRDPRGLYFGLPRAPTQSYNFLFYDMTQTTPWVTESFYVEAYTGELQNRLHFGLRSLLGKIDTIRYSLHTGTIGGLTGRILACIASAILAALCVTGPWMWWKRRPRGKLGAPPPPKRRSWLLLAIAGGAALAFPLIGYTIVALAIFELVRFAIHRLRARRVAKIAPLSVLVFVFAGSARADDAYDADGDGDGDADDRALAAAAEQIEITDVSAVRQSIDSARAVSVIDTKQARERTADLGEVLSREQGLQVRRFGGLGAPARFSLDGLYDDQVRFFLDGLPLELVGFGLGVSNVPVELIQRIEVHRGVVPVALGADALGGAVELITDPSWVDRASASYQVGSFGTHRATATARAKDARTGLALGLALTFDRADNDYQVEAEVSDEVGHLSTQRVRRFHDAYTAGTANVEAGIVDRGALRRAVVRAYATRYAKELQNDLVMTVPYGEAEYGEAARGATADVLVEKRGWSLRAAGGVASRWIDFRDASKNIYDWNGNVIDMRPTAGELGTATDQRVRQTAAFARVVGEYGVGAHAVRIAVAPTRISRAGSDYTDTDPSTRNALSARRDLTQLVVGGEWQVRSARVENLAFAKLYASWLSAEQLEPGYMFRDVDRTMRRYGIGDGVRVSLTSGLAVKASYEWALRLPSVDEIFGNGVLVRANLALAPERSHNANVGVRYDAAGRLGTVAGEARGFARFADDLIVLLGGDRFVSYQNVFAARILGAAASGRWESPGRALALDGSVTIQDIRNDSSAGAFGGFAGDRIPNRPWWLGAAGATYRLRDVLRANDELSGFVQSRFVYKFYRSWESLGAADSKQTIPTQLVHSIGATYAMRGATPVVVTLELQNIADSKVYDSYGVQRPGRTLALKIGGEL